MDTYVITYDLGALRGERDTRTCTLEAPSLFEARLKFKGLRPLAHFVRAELEADRPWSDGQMGDLD